MFEAELRAAEPESLEGAVEERSRRGAAALASNSANQRAKTERTCASRCPCSGRKGSIPGHEEAVRTVSAPRTRAPTHRGKSQSCAPAPRHLLPAPPGGPPAIQRPVQTAHRATGPHRVQPVILGGHRPDRLSIARRTLDGDTLQNRSAQHRRFGTTRRNQPTRMRSHRQPRRQWNARSSSTTPSAGAIPTAWNAWAQPSPPQANNVR